MPNQSELLLVDDNEDDVLLVRRAFAQARILNPLRIVRTGEEAVEYISGTGRYANRAEYPLPGVVLLDLKMPGMSGFDVLRWIRLQPGFGSLRVVVLTSSQDIRDVSAAYQLGANSFLVKPVDFERLVEISQALNGYWLWMDRSPEVERPAAGSLSDTELIRRLSPGVSTIAEITAPEIGSSPAAGGNPPNALP
jgi:CheY-like chemotaxis protein